ncbi:hypothetical protein WJ0W_004392 [Paenibacillus melissococcoides]|uniref:Uncharacterized protein n=1 Tax=Paenibacillus melissococcoides TaxID=2912268 RepID=A0ABN8U7P7_9BACL|nr:MULTISPECIES: hypothetical protein [Paenibacillus]MEB9896232.1 hypothetical protein [Bacillus cereus]CAH8247157.1 hypothetical protein WJ0W_004392 [Paenibacillus melissococcoides]CAH8716903.1 hypothetical protein HTL2_004761 [Paenibacillus melissococcoides]CAH8717866.1 hypothetical protein WDD9_005034 [Paenibacillus melissococcoides]GIO79820.1 hypothetical protein J6TS7_34300 [Paenibacillus dendritiformis]
MDCIYLKTDVPDMGLTYYVEVDGERVARREELAPGTPPEYLYPGHRADGIVLGYDEDNFWLVLGDVQVSEENIAIEWG